MLLKTCAKNKLNLYEIGMIMFRTYCDDNPSKLKLILRKNKQNLQLSGQFRQK